MILGHKSDLRLGRDFVESARRQVPYATAVALTRTARKIADAIGVQIKTVFDRPTPYTQSAVRVTSATRQSLVARVDFKEAAGKGISADKFLQPQVFGGPRRMKRSERALGRAGLPTHSFLVPGAGAEMDAYGNMSRGQLVRVMSYLQTFGEQGYRANSTEKSRARLAKRGKTAEGYKTINGVVYFTSRGKGTMAGNRQQTLPAGVWMKTGIHGFKVKPVLLAIDQPTYQPRLPFYETAEQVHGENFDAEYTTALDVAMATAR